MNTSFLFPLELQGKDTPEIESFPSYLHRLAFQHGMYVGELIRIADHYSEKITEHKQLLHVPRYATVPELVRPEGTTLALIELFNTLTNQKLEVSILWIIDNCLGRSNNEIVQGFRWCPECIGEMLSMGSEPYFKLIWHLSAISACPIHRTPFLSKCDFCHCKQTSYKKTCSLGYCQNCRKTLSKRKLSLRAKDIRESWEDIGLDIVELFRDLAQVLPYSLPEDGTYKSVDEIFDYYWNKNREDIFYKSLSRDELLAIVFKQSSISLMSARRIAYKLGISLFCLMSGDAVKTSGVLDAEYLCALPPGYLDVSRKTRKDHMLILSRIKDVIRATSSPQSLKAIAKTVGVSVGYLEYRHPILVKDIVRKYLDYCDESMLKKKYFAQKCALDFFFNEKYSERPHSRKQAYRVLREETGLPKHLLRDAIKVAYTCARN